MPRIFSHYLLREVGFWLVSVLAAVLLVLIGGIFGRLLAAAGSGELAPEVVGWLILFTLPEQLALALPIALLLAIVFGVGRLYRDHEAFALAGSGFGPEHYLRPLLLLALVLAIPVGALSLSVAPWAARQTLVLREAGEQEASLSLLQPGRFLSFQGGQAVFYAEQADRATGRLEDILIRFREDDQGVVIRARQGWTRRAPDGARELVLEDGWRYTGIPGDAAYQVVRFETHVARYHLPQLLPKLSKRSMQPLSQLLRAGGAADWAEIHRRLAAPVSLLGFALLALPLARTPPRRRGNGLLWAVLAYVVFGNLLGVGRSWLEQQWVPAWVGLWWVHVAVAGTGLLLLAYQNGRIRRFPVRFRLRGKPS
ncbi:MAG: LPS export ABC transporter permease LptF [Candidatus Macondimonas sp.]